MIDIKVPASGSSGNMALVSDGETPLLLDCGVSTKKLAKYLREAGTKLSSIKACLVTHQHRDHCAAVPYLLEMGKRCYMNPETAKSLGVAEHHRVEFIYSQHRFSIGTWDIVAFPAVHDVPCLGYYIGTGTERLLYLVDSAYSKYTFAAMTHVMIGCNYDKFATELPSYRKTRVISSHASLKTVEDWFKANDLSALKEVWLLHLSDGNSDAEAFRKSISDITRKEVHIA